MPRILRQMLVKDGLKVDGTAAGPQNPAQAAANNQINHAERCDQDMLVQHLQMQLQQADSQCQKLYDQLEYVKQQHLQEIHAATVRLAEEQAEHAATADDLLAALSELSFVKQELAESCKAAQVAKFKGASPEAEGAGPEAEGAGPEAEGAGPETEGAGPEAEGAGPEAESSAGKQEVAPTAVLAEPIKLIINISGCCDKACCQAAVLQEAASVPAPEQEQHAGDAAVPHTGDAADASSTELLEDGEIDTAINAAVDGQQWWLDQPKDKKPLNSTNPSAYLSTLAAEMAAVRPSAAAAAEPVHPAPISIKVLGGTIKSAVGQVKKRMPGNRSSSAASSILAAVKPAASKAPAKVDIEDVPVTPSFFRRTSSYAAELFGRSSGGAGGSAPGNEPEASSNRQAPAFIKLLRRRSRKTTDC